MHVNSVRCIKLIGKGAPPWEWVIGSEIYGHWNPEGVTMAMLPGSPEIVIEEGLQGRETVPAPGTLWFQEREGSSPL